MSEPGNELLQRYVASAGAEPNYDQIEHDLGEIQLRLATLEDEVLRLTVFKLKETTTSRQRTECDTAFGYFTQCILFPYATQALASRAAIFSRCVLIPKVLEIEASRSIEFHKGALFYDTALAHLAVSDEARFEYFLAMADEEDFKTHAVEAKPRQRGTHNLRQGPLSEQTIQASVRFATDLLNGVLSSNTASFSFIFGSPVTDARVDQWRRNLDGLHHAELFRLLYEAELFYGQGMPEYCAVKDHPYIMLRLVKTLAHAGQWVESRLTALQKSLPAGTIGGSTLSPKLSDDPAFGPLVHAAGSKQNFSGNCPKTKTAVDAELLQLLVDLQIQTAVDQRDWRTLRIFYIIRNCTAHQIDESLRSTPTASCSSNCCKSSS